MIQSASVPTAGTTTSTVPQLTLASASPRRRELLALLGLPFVVAANSGEEQDDPPPEAVLACLPVCPLPLRHHPTLLAWRKVNAACADGRSGVIIGADTDVVLGAPLDAGPAEVLGKPRDPAHARAMLARLAGRNHMVYTGICLLNDAEPWHAPLSDAPFSAAPYGAGTIRYALTASVVTIAALTEAQIAAYVATGEPLDKAGAYGIQGLGGRLVQRVSGSYTAVVGLPLPTLAAMLHAAGLTPPVDPVQAYHHWLRDQGKEPLACPPTLP